LILTSRNYVILGLIRDRGSYQGKLEDVDVIDFVPIL